MSKIYDVTKKSDSDLVAVYMDIEYELRKRLEAVNKPSNELIDEVFGLEAFERDIISILKAKLDTIIYVEVEDE